MVSIRHVQAVQVILLVLVQHSPLTNTIVVHVLLDSFYIDKQINVSKESNTVLTIVLLVFVKDVSVSIILVLKHVYPFRKNVLIGINIQEFVNNVSKDLYHL